MLKHMPSLTCSRSVFCIQWQKIVCFTESNRGMVYNFHFFPPCSVGAHSSPCINCKVLCWKTLQSVHIYQSERNPAARVRMVDWNHYHSSFLTCKPASQSVSLGLLFSLCAAWLKWDLLAPARKVLGRVILKAIQVYNFLKKDPQTANNP